MSTQHEIETLCKSYREYKRLAEEAQVQADSIGDELKQYMKDTNQDKAIIGEYKLSYTDVSRKDIDKKRLETEQATIYAAYLKESSYKRFLVS